MPAADPSPTRAVAIGAGAVVLALAAFAAAGALTTHRAGSGSAPSARTRVAAARWDAQAARAIGPAARIIGPTADALNKHPDEPETAATLAAAAVTFERAERALRALPPSPAGQRVNDLYAASLALGRAWIALEQRAPHGGSATSELRRSGRRVRELGDRVFDQGRVLLAPLLPRAEPAGVEVVRPAEVPDWAREGLAPGPPLAPAVAQPAGGAPIRVERRPEQSRSAWRRAVRSSGAPPLVEVRAAAGAGDAVRLGRAAAATDAAVERLRLEPDPRGDRAGAAVVDLGLLVTAEAARIRILADYADDPAVTGAVAGTATRLLDLAAVLWASDLPAR